MIDAWYLPGLDQTAAAEEDWHAGRTAGGVRFRAPRLRPAEAAQLADRVRSAAEDARRERTISEVVRAVAGAARRLSDRDDPLGAHTRSILEEALRWPEPLVTETLAGMSRLWTPDQLDLLLRSELGDPEVLDTFRPDPLRRGRRRRACGPPLLFVTLSGNVPGVAVTAVIRGLLARSGILCKLPEDEPVLLVGFARALAEEDALLGQCLAASWWPATHDDPCWSEWMSRAGKVVVYGGADAVAGVRGRARSDAEVVVYGPRIGVAVLLPDAPDAAAALARDVCAYEQQGCVSPRLVYVVGSGAEEFAAQLADSLAAEVDRLEVPAPAAPDASAIRAVRAEWEFRGYGAGGSRRVFGRDDDLRWTVLASDRPEVEAVSLPRVVYVHAAEEVAAMEKVLTSLGGRIQVLGYAGEEGLEEVGEAAVRLGVSRVAPLGSVAWPPADWRHDGRHQILPLVNWTDLETPQ